MLRLIFSKRPLVAALLVVDDQIAVLQADLVEILAVETGQAQAVEPVEAGEQSVLRLGRRVPAPRRPALRHGACGAGNVGAMPASRFEVTPVASGLAVSPADTDDLAVRRNPDREFGIDQIEALGAQPPHQQRGAGQSHFGLRRGGDDGVVAVAHHDVADSHRDPDPPGTLDLRAADLDRIAVADIVLDRRRKPRRRDVEIDRTGAEPPPQPAETAGEDDGQHRDDDGDALDPALAGQPSLTALQTCRPSR